MTSHGFSGAVRGIVVKALCPGLGVFATVRDKKMAKPLTNR
jgi:hypothetical protein